MEAKVKNPEKENPESLSIRNNIITLAEAFTCLSFLEAKEKR